MSWSVGEIEKAWFHMRCNSAEVSKSTLCVCMQCESYFPAGRVTEWLNPMQSGAYMAGPVPLSENAEAFCPVCKMDYVIGDASGLPIQNREFVRAVRGEKVD